MRVVTGVVEGHSAPAAAARRNAKAAAAPQAPRSGERGGGERDPRDGHNQLTGIFQSNPEKPGRQSRHLRINSTDDKGGHEELRPGSTRSFFQGTGPATQNGTSAEQLGARLGIYKSILIMLKNVVTNKKF